MLCQVRPGSVEFIPDSSECLLAVMAGGGPCRCEQTTDWELSRPVWHVIGLALTTSHDLCRGNEVLLNIFYEKSIEVVKKAWIDSTSGYHMLMEEIFLDGLALPASRDLSRRSISAGPFRCLWTLYIPDFAHTRRSGCCICTLSSMINPLPIGWKYSI